MPPALNIFKHVNQCLSNTCKRTQSVGVLFFGESTWNLGSVLPETLLLLLLLLSHYH